MLLAGSAGLVQTMHRCDAQVTIPYSYLGCLLEANSHPWVCCHMQCSGEARAEPDCPKRSDAPAAPPVIEGGDGGAGLQCWVLFGS